MPTATYLTADALRRLVQQHALGQYAVAPNLSLKIAKGRQPFWLCVYILNGKRRAHSLGGYAALSVGQARAAADRIRVQVDAGIDPQGEKQRAHSRLPEPPTFGQAIAGFYAEKAHEHRASTVAGEWDRFRQHLEPLQGVRFADLDFATVLGFLRPFWQRGHISTGTKVRSFAERCWYYGQTDDHAANPWLWQRLKAKLSKLPAEQNLPCVPYPRLPAVVGRLLGADGLAAAATVFCILTASRPGEVTGLPYGELDLASAVWTLPAGRDKEHCKRCTPLSGAAVACLRYAQAVTHADGTNPSALVFPGHGATGRLMRETLCNTLRRHLEPADWDTTLAGPPRAPTVHASSRASFKSYMTDESDHPREQIELVLGHRIGDGAENAYYRPQSLTKRRAILDAWATYLGVAKLRLTHETVTSVTDPAQKIGAA